MDYTKIVNTIKKFESIEDIDDFQRIWNDEEIYDFLYFNFSNVNIRKNLLNIFFKCFPKNLKWNEHSKRRLSLYNEIYKLIMSMYHQNRMEMYDDLILTEFYSDLSPQEKKDFVRDHRDIGNELKNGY